MKTTFKNLREAIRNIIVQEINIKDVHGLNPTAGSTHEMNIAKIAGDERKFFVKFSDIDSDLWNDNDPDPSMQCMSEYLAYRVYSLYPHVKLPSRIELVYDPSNERVGIATAAVTGKMALGRVKPQELAKKMEAGVYVDIFIANHDVVGTGTGNVMVTDDDSSAVRIDPGSAFKYRAQGGRKGTRWNTKASELDTMLDPKFGYGEASGRIFQYVDLKAAAKEFLSVPWSKIATIIDSTRKEVASELKENGMEDLLDQWNAEVDDIKRTLEKRHSVVTTHAKNVISS